MFMKRILCSLSIVVMVLGAVFYGTSASAASYSSTGLSITPRKNLAIDPGKGVNDKLSIGNLDTHADLQVAIQVVDFTFLDSSGTPKLMLGKNDPQTTWSLKPYITIPNSIVVPAGQTREISYSVKIPANLGAGSYYSAIEYSATGGNGGNVGLNASGVTLMFVTVSGLAHEDLQLQQFGAYQSNANTTGGNYINIATHMPQQMAYTLKNNGNVAESPSGGIVMNYMFGNKPIQISNVNANSSLVLLGQSRVFTTCIQAEKQSVVINGTQGTSNVCTSPGLLPGRYTATLSIFYGQNGNPTRQLSGTASFWYLPWWFIGLFFVFVLLLTLAIWWAVRKVRRMLYGKPIRRK